MAESRRTERLRRSQDERERVERTRSKQATDPDEAARHARRAEKAGYLAAKLREAEAAEREGD